MDTRFSVAIHVLTMISEERDRELSSQDLAVSVGTNASHIRRVIGQVKAAGLIESSRGRSGYRLTRLPSDISLLDIYRAVQGVDRVLLFHAHPNPNEECPVGRHIESALRPVFADVERQLEEALAAHSLEDVIDNLYAQAHRSRPERINAR
ncbi:Rrf2 family transcriptional regulator [Actinomyces trachealis]|uniref:Rrf2 family transcriptional regulator n=1 Tax=Actinomyces trachealis TaxID=2763540 RepID=UPI0018929FC4|nr:Rrf2 family transcriptional regulator [Actinomyces trachealis]